MGNARSTGRSVIMADCGECSNDAGAVEGTEFGRETVDPNGAETEAPPPNGRDGCRVVKTTKGYVVGRRLIVSDATADGQERAVDYYLGIPYAKPPILPELRFKVSTFECFQFLFHLFVHSFRCLTRLMPHFTSYCVRYLFCR